VTAGCEMMAVMSSTREMLTEALHLYARHRKALLMAAGLLLLPVGAVMTVAGAVAKLPFVPPFLRDEWAASAGTAVIWGVDLFVSIVTWGVVTTFVARHLSGKPIDWRSAWRRGLERARPVVTANLAAALPAIGYFLLAMIPIVIVRASAQAGAPQSVAMAWLDDLLLGAVLAFFAVRFAFVTCVAVVERQGGFLAYRRNLQLLEGRFLRVAAVVTPIEIGRQLLDRLSDWALSASAFHEAASHVVWWLFLPLEVAAATIVYQRIRAEAEGYDTAQLAQDLER